MKPKRLFVVKRVLPVVAGGLLGYAYYYYFGIYSWDLLWKLGEYIEVTGNLHQDFDHRH